MIAVIQRATSHTLQAKLLLNQWLNTFAVTPFVARQTLVCKSALQGWQQELYRYCQNQASLKIFLQAAREGLTDLTDITREDLTDITREYLTGITREDLSLQLPQERCFALI